MTIFIQKRRDNLKNLNSFTHEPNWINYGIFNVVDKNFGEKEFPQNIQSDSWINCRFLDISEKEFLTLENLEQRNSVLKDIDFLFIIITGSQLQEIGISKFCEIIKNIQCIKLPIIFDINEHFESTDKYQGISSHCIVKNTLEIETVLLGLIYPPVDSHIVGFDLQDLKDFFEDSGRIIVYGYEGSENNFNFPLESNALKGTQSGELFISFKFGNDFSLSDIMESTTKVKEFLDPQKEVILVSVCYEKKYHPQKMKITIYVRENKLNEGYLLQKFEKGDNTELDLPPWVKNNQ